MKRKWFGLVLLGLGTFLLVVGVLTVTWAPGVVKRTPIDTNETTYLTGTVKKLNLETGELEENPVKVQSINQADTDVSDDDVVAWVQQACVVIDVDDAPDCVDGEDPRLVNAYTDVFATDRVTAESVNDEKYLPADFVEHEGVVNKWPFDAGKKTYTYWDNVLKQGVDAVYDRTETLHGVEVYVYKVSISDAEAEITDGVQGVYDDAKEIWVEPQTGAIQQQIDDQQRYLPDGTQVLDLKIQFTDEQVADKVDDVKSSKRSLDLITVWAPIIGFGAGALCVLVGLAVLVRSRRAGGGPAAGQRELVGSAR